MQTCNDCHTARYQLLTDLKNTIVYNDSDVQV